MAVSVLLVDEHQLIRQALRAVLESQPGIAVVGEARAGEEVLTLVGSLLPQILLIDVKTLPPHTLELLRQVSRQHPNTRIILLARLADESAVLAALRQGAAGYVLKESSAAVLLLAVQHVAAGRLFLDPVLAHRAIEAYLAQTEAASADRYQTLTPREREVLHLVLAGHGTRAIAERLYLSPRTVESHRAALMRKLGLQTQTDLVRYAIKRRLLSLEGP
jgi:DNA-binding NarL/FixJ family response regulator